MNIWAFLILNKWLFLYWELGYKIHLINMLKVKNNQYLFSYHICTNLMVNWLWTLMQCNKNWFLIQKHCNKFLLFLFYDLYKSIHCIHIIYQKNRFNWIIIDYWYILAISFIFYFFILFLSLWYFICFNYFPYVYSFLKYKMLTHLPIINIFLTITKNNNKEPVSTSTRCWYRPK